MNARPLLVVVVLVVLFRYLPNGQVAAQDSGDLCATPGNLIPDSICRFNDFRALPGFGSVANGWGAFINSGTPDFNGRDCDSPEPPCQRIWSDGGLFDAGIYYQASVTPNQGYRARLGWFTPMCDGPSQVGRIGIDPTGGTNPNSPDIVWSNWTRLNKSNSYGVHQISALARHSTITVFINGKFQSQCSRGNVIWMDAIILVPDGSVPTLAPTAPPATNTPRPTPTNTRVPPTRTPTPAPATHTPVPTSTFTATATAVNTATPSPTPTPTDTNTPVPTITRRLINTPTPEPQALTLAANETATMDVLAFGLLGASGCSLVAAVGLGLFAFWFWRRR